MGLSQQRSRYLKGAALLTCAGMFVAGCMADAENLAPTTVVDGITATVARTDDVAIVTLNAKNPSDFDGQQAMVSRAGQAAEVLTGCYVAPGPRKELDAYVGGAQPIRIAFDLQC
ncbi:hypothetical protein [Roseovarius sp. 2305UL8-3]|uniref:hypothetical protein n=1 Tax=Roseovarius conchicola TaxID=3121636 RepID=UPI00352858B4